MRKTFFSVLVAAGAICLLADGNLSAGRCTQGSYVPWSGRPSPDNSPCGGRSIPISQRRDGRNLRLECGSSVDHYFRGPFNITEDTVPPELLAKVSQIDGVLGANSIEDLKDELYWAEEKNDWKLHQELMMLIYPDIKWSGRMDYETFEVWEWTACEWGHDSACPDRVWMETETYKDTDGNLRTRQVERREPEPCWHEENHTERRHCSFEQMTYDAEFHRYTPSEWNPSSDGYYPIIANKNNLLPMEYEDVQVFSQRTGLFGNQGVLHPGVEVPKGYNKYSSKLQFQGSGQDTAACLYDHDYHVNIRIYTDKRDTNRKTPNALTAPVDEFGDELSPFTNWLAGLDKNGETIELRPEAIGLTNAASVAASTVAAQSRAMEAAIEKAKSEEGLGSNFASGSADSGSRKDLEEGGYWAKTRIRVTLYELRWLIDKRKTERFKTTAAKVIAFSDNQGFDQYRFELQDFYMASDWPVFEYLSDTPTHLVPGKRYEFRIEMFQEDNPFYKQSNFGGGVAWSDSLKLEFKRPNADDRRGITNKFRNWLAEPFWMQLVGGSL